MTCPYCSGSTAGEHEYNCQMNPENPMKSIPADFEPLKPGDYWLNRFTVPSVTVESECCEKCSCPGIGFEYQSGAIHTMCSGDFCHDPSCPCHKSVPVEKWEKELRELDYKILCGKPGEYSDGDATFLRVKLLSQALQAAVEEERHRISELLTVNLETSKMLDGWEKYWVEVEGGRFIERCIECENDKRIRYAIINKHQ